MRTTELSIDPRTLKKGDVVTLTIKEEVIFVGEGTFTTNSLYLEFDDLNGVEITNVERKANFKVGDVVKFNKYGDFEVLTLKDEWVVLQRVDVGGCGPIVRTVTEVAEFNV